VSNRNTKRRKHTKLHHQATGYVRCAESGKLRYPRRKVALTVMNELRTLGRPVQSVYQCRYCGDWHLTKQA
jgi:hypothetical protein